MSCQKFFEFPNVIRDPGFHGGVALTEENEREGSIYFNGANRLTHQGIWRESARSWMCAEGSGGYAP